MKVLLLRLGAVITNLFLKLFYYAGDVKKIYLKIDRIFCGKTQLPAFDLLKIVQNSKIISKLVIYRFLILFNLAFELLGSFLITYGLISIDAVSFLIFGICFKSGGGVLSAFFQNKAGLICSLELEESLKNLKTHSQEIKSFLAEKGCSETEIQSLPLLPTNIYQAELISYVKNRIMNIGTPLSCGIGLLACGEIGIAIFVMLLGLISFPIGEYFYKEHIFRHESEIRMGKSAGFISYLKNIYQDHINLTIKVNLLSQLPLYLFLLRVLWSKSGHLLANFYGITQGLIGLSESLAFQKARMSATHNVSITKNLIDTLNSSLLLITNKRWDEHCAKPSYSSSVIKNLLNEGVAFVDFSVPFISIKDQQKKCMSLTADIPMGGIGVLQALSGKGKSTFLGGLLHLLEHTGDFYFVNPKEWQDVHSLERDNFNNHICYLKEDRFEKSARLVDLFKEIADAFLTPFLQDLKMQMNSNLSKLALSVADNLLEKEIENLKHDLKSVFLKKDLNFLKELRKKRSDFVSQILKNSKGNLDVSQIFPERFFSTLSSGEKQKILMLLSYYLAKQTNDKKLMIFDEPLAHLDDSSIEWQMDILKKIQQLPSPPAILIISHIEVNRLLKNLENSTLLNIKELYHNENNLNIVEKVHKSIV